MAEGSSATYTVKLNTEPSSDVVLALTSNNAEVTIADTDGETDGVQNTLTFTSTDWDTPQTVTVNAGEDDDAVNDAAAIAHAVVDGSSADEYDPVANVDLAVTVTDDDTAGVTVSVTHHRHRRATPSPWGRGSQRGHLHGQAQHPAFFRCRHRDQQQQRRGDHSRHRYEETDGRPEHPDLHVQQLGHSDPPDGDGERPARTTTR